MSGTISSSSGIALNTCLEAFWHTARTLRERVPTMPLAASKRLASRSHWPPAFQRNAVGVSTWAMPIIERLTPKNGWDANRKVFSSYHTQVRCCTALVAYKGKPARDCRKEISPMTNDNARRSALQQLIQDDAVGQLRRGDGLMATLGSEDGALKLDWVEGVARLLADPAQLEEVEAEARDIWQRGIRHMIWAGMGGSVIAVRVLCDLGFCSSRDEGQVTIYQLDSTDPAALNEIVRKIAAAKNLARPSGEEASNPTFLRALLNDVMMVGVALGMTSEEP